MPTRQRNLESFKCLVTVCGIQWNPRQRRCHFHALKASFARRVFTRCKESPTHAFPGKRRMGKESTNARWIVGRIEQNIVSGMAIVASSVKRAAFAPSTASGNLSANLGDIVSAVINELSVHAKDGMNGSLNLLRGIPACLQVANRTLDQAL